MDVIAFAVGMIALLIWFLVSNSMARDRARAAHRAAGASLHCLTCGEDSKPLINGALRGSTVIELALWFTLFGGLIYSIWRRSGKFKPECPVCHSNQVVPIGSKAAIAYAKRLANP